MPTITAMNAALRGLNVPGPSDLQAAWDALPAETRDRIGVHALTFAFYDWLATDDQAPPGDRLLPDAVVDFCDELANEATNDIFTLAAKACPALYGGPEEGPPWAWQVDR